VLPLLLGYQIHYAGLPTSTVKLIKCLNMSEFVS